MLYPQGCVSIALLDVECVIEQAVYLHCNPAHLKFLRDGNKGNFRLAQTAALVLVQVLRLLFEDTLISNHQKVTLSFKRPVIKRPVTKHHMSNFLKRTASLLFFWLIDRIPVTVVTFSGDGVNPRHSAPVYISRYKKMIQIVKFFLPCHAVPPRIKSQADHAPGNAKGWRSNQRRWQWATPH